MNAQTTKERRGSMSSPWVTKAVVSAVSLGLTLGLLYLCLTVTGSTMRMLMGQPAYSSFFAHWSLVFTPCVLAVVLYMRWRTRRAERQKQQTARTAAGAGRPLRKP